MYALSLHSLSDTIDVYLLQGNFANQLYLHLGFLAQVYLLYTSRGSKVFSLNLLPILLNQTLMKNFLFAFWGGPSLSDDGMIFFIMFSFSFAQV